METNTSLLLEAELSTADRSQVLASLQDTQRRFTWRQIDKDQHITDAGRKQEFNFWRARTAIIGSLLPRSGPLEEQVDCEVTPARSSEPQTRSSRPFLRSGPIGATSRHRTRSSEKATFQSLALFVPRRFGGRGAEDVGSYATGKVFPQIQEGASPTGVDWSSWLGRNLGLPNYEDQTRRHRR
jgi:hypothetical protein